MLCVDWLARKRGWLKGIYPDCRIPLHTCILSSWRHIDYQFHWQQLLGYVHTCVPISVHFFRLNLSLNGRIRNPIHSYGVKISSVCIILHPFRILPLFYAEEWTEHTLFFFPFTLNWKLRSVWIFTLKSMWTDLYWCYISKHPFERIRSPYLRLWRQKCCNLTHSQTVPNHSPLPSVSKTTEWGADIVCIPQFLVNGRPWTDDYGCHILSSVYERTSV